MSQVPPPPVPPVPPAAVAAKPHKEQVPSKIYLVSYPKVIFLYPTFLTALFCAIFLNFVEGQDLAKAGSANVIATSIFLGVFTVNMVVFSFDFPRTTSLTVFFLIAALIMGGFLWYQYQPEVFGFIGNVLGALHPVANSTFFTLFSVLLGLIYLAVLFIVQFDYWEVRPNELLHHHGFLSDLKRFAAPNLRIDKEVNDVFEYMLLGSGRLILHPSSEPRAIVLENVLLIDRKEGQITKMLGALQVQIRRGDQE